GRRSARGRWLRGASQRPTRPRYWRAPRADRRAGAAGSEHRTASRRGPDDLRAVFDAVGAGRDHGLARRETREDLGELFAARPDRHGTHARYAPAVHDADLEPV